MILFHDLHMFMCTTGMEQILYEKQKYTQEFTAVDRQIDQSTIELHRG